jgi:hypothetical protein
LNEEHKHPEAWNEPQGEGDPWFIHWPAVVIGALVAVAAVLLLGLLGMAVGLTTANVDRAVDSNAIGLEALAISVIGVVLSFLLGGWGAGKVADLRYSDPALLHGAVVWLLALPILIVLAGIEASNYLAGWAGGIGTSSRAMVGGSPFDRPEPPGVKASEEERAEFMMELLEYRKKVNSWREDSAKAMRSGALVALTALLFGLGGSLAGSWLARGQRLISTYHRPRRHRPNGGTPLLIPGSGLNAATPCPRVEFPPTKGCEAVAETTPGEPGAPATGEASRERSRQGVG